MIFYNLFLRISFQKLYKDTTKINWDKESKLNKNEYIQSVEQHFIDENRVISRIGDIINVGFQIKEGNKERAQYYEGTNLAKRNSGTNLTYTTRKTSSGVGVERNFFLYSPKVETITIKQSSKVRRSKLYFLRLRYGKAARLRKKFYKKIKELVKV